MNKIKVILADDHQIVLDGIQLILEKHPEIEVLGTAANGKKAIELLQKYPEVNIAVLDISMPEMDGLEATKVIQTDYPNVKVLALSMHGDAEKIHGMISAGVSGYILKNRGKEELVDALKEITAGGKYLGTEVTNVFLDSISKPAKKNANTKNVSLTKREVEVLKQIGNGLTSPEIAEKLFIEQSTVETHRRNLLKKLDVKNSLRLVKYAIENGYMINTPV